MVTKHLTSDDLRRIFDASTQLGASQAMIDRVLASAAVPAELQSGV